jgi:hypothetical protein
MTQPPEPMMEPTFGSLQAMVNPRGKWIHLHLAAYLHGKEADNIEKAGRWLIQAAEWLRSKDADDDVRVS